MSIVFYIVHRTVICIHLALSFSLHVYIFAANTAKYIFTISGYYCPNGTETSSQYPCPPGTFNNRTHATSLVSPSIGHVHEYPTMHYWGIPRHIQSTKVYIRF